MGTLHIQGGAEKGMKVVEFFTATFIEILGFLIAMLGGLWLVIHFNNTGTNIYLSIGIIFVFVLVCIYGSMWLGDRMDRKK